MPADQDCPTTFLLEFNNDQRAARILECAVAPDKSMLVRLLKAYESKVFKCVKVELTDYQHALLRVRLIAAIESRGGHFDVDRERWKAEGDRLRKILPW